MTLFPEKISNTRHDRLAQTSLMDLRAGMPMDTRQTMDAMRYAQFSEQGKDWVMIYFRGRNNSLLGQCEIPLSGDRETNLSHARAWFERKYPGCINNYMVCHE